MIRRIVSINGKPHVMGCGCNAGSVIHAETDPHKLTCPECGASYVAWNPVSEAEQLQAARNLLSRMAMAAEKVTATKSLQASAVLLRRMCEVLEAKARGIND